MRFLIWDYDASNQITVIVNVCQKVPRFNKNSIVMIEITKYLRYLCI